MTSTLGSARSLPLDTLRQAVRGRVVTPSETDFDHFRTLVYGGFDAKPSAIVRVADAADVRALVGLARDTGVELAVRGGGHSLAGHSTTEGGVVMDIRDLTGLEIDPAARTAWAGAGLTAAAYTQAAAEHGLATGFGDTGSVGIGGITLGGGIGYLVRTHGLTIDNLLAAEIVTADGEIRHTDASTEPDLFWAIRGGGGNFGVATRFQFRLHPVDGIVGGLLVLPATRDVIAGFVAAADAAPDELSTIANVMPCPPMPFVPEEHHGSLVVFAILCHAGAGPSGERAVAPFRQLANPLADMVQEMPYPGIYFPDEEDYHPLAVARTMFVDHVDGLVANTILEFLESSDASMRVAQLRALGGAITRVPDDATAYAHRSSRAMVNVAAFYEGPDDKPRRQEWVDRFVSALHQGDGGAYVNFLADEGPERVRAAYPGATWDRLRAIKRRYDPTNVFRLNQNIPPAD